MKLFRKKFNVRILPSKENKVYYVQYAYYRFFPIWKNIRYRLTGYASSGVYRLWTDYEKAENFAKRFDTIEKVREYNEKLNIALGKTKEKAKIIYSK